MAERALALIGVGRSLGSCHEPVRSGSGRLGATIGAASTAIGGTNPGFGGPSPLHGAMNHSPDRLSKAILLWTLGDESPHAAAEESKPSSEAPAEETPVDEANATEPEVVSPPAEDETDADRDDAWYADYHGKDPRPSMDHEP